LVSHILIPKHEVMADDEVEELLKKYNITKDKLPKIYEFDAAISGLNPEPKPGEVIKILRKSPTAGNIFYYRVVVPGTFHEKGASERTEEEIAEYADDVGEEEEEINE